MTDQKLKVIESITLRVWITVKNTWSPTSVVQLSILWY